jgi:hypothetical protein
MTECEVHRQRIEESPGVRPALVDYVRGMNVILKGKRFLQNDCGGAMRTYRRALPAKSTEPQANRHLFGDSQ